MNKKKINWGYFGSLILSVVLALAVGAAIMAATGYDPLNAYHELFRGATGCDNLGQVFTGLFTKRQFGNTVEYAMGRGLDIVDLPIVTEDFTGF